MSTNVKNQGISSNTRGNEYSSKTQDVSEDVRERVLTTKRDPIRVLTSARRS